LIKINTESKVVSRVTEFTCKQRKRIDVQ